MQVDTLAKPTIEEMKARVMGEVMSTTTGTSMTVMTSTTPKAAAPTPNASGFVGIKGVLVIEGELTGDKRMVAPDGCYWEEGPWSLMFRNDNEGHPGASVVGRIDNLARMGNRIMFEGVISSTVPDGSLSVQMIHDQLIRGISLDPDDAEVQHRLADGRVLEEMSIEELDALTEEEWNSVYMYATQLRVRGGTMLAMPAFVDTELELFQVDDLVASALVASAATNEESLPPSWWFENPNLKELTPLTVTKDGRVFGHIAPWGQCHIGMNGACVTPPKSASGYAFYTRGVVRAWCESCAREEEMAVGPITAQTGHATGKLSMAQAVAHYDNSGSVVGNVAAGEDTFGIWVAGGIAPTASQGQIDSLISMGVSGDWRRRNGALELAAVLSVPVSGYPIPRRTVATHVASGVQNALVTALFGGSTDPKVDIDRRLVRLEKMNISLMAEKVKAV